MFFTLSVTADDRKLSGCMCVSENGYIPNAFIVKDLHVWSLSRCAQGDDINWCLSPRYSFSMQDDEIVFETKSVVGAKDTWRINRVTGRTTQRVEDKFGRAIGGDLCNCQFSEDFETFVENVLIASN